MQKVTGGLQLAARHEAAVLIGGVMPPPVHTASAAGRLSLVRARHRAVRTAQPLNVLIGPNGSGKSNVIEAMELLRATPTDLAAAIRDGGGPLEWLWKGDAPPSPAIVEVELDRRALQRPAAAIPAGIRGSAEPESRSWTKRSRRLNRFQANRMCCSITASNAAAR